MDRSLGIYTKRRLIRSTILLFTAAIVLFVSNMYESALYKPEFLNGWVLFGLFVFLALFNARKKLSFLPLGSGYNWSQLHIYGGLLAAFVFFVHIDFSLPNGLFDTALASLFLLEVISGVTGIALQRAFPKMLARSQLDEDIMYERIPGIRSNIIEEIEELVGKSVEADGSVALLDFYRNKLQPYLVRPTDFWIHLFNARRVYVQWGGEFEALHRFLNAGEMETLNRIRQLTMSKIDLDARYAKQSIMKRWLFLHIPLSYSLLLLVLVHMMLAYSFFGGP